MLPALVIQDAGDVRADGGDIDIGANRKRGFGSRVWARFPGPFAIDFIFQFSRVSHISKCDNKIC